MSESFDKNEMANTNEVRTHWGLAVNLHRREKRLAEFDRWLEQVIRRARAEAWEVGRSMGLADHSASMRAGRPLRTPNPYAEETADDHT